MNEIKVTFRNSVSDKKLKYAVIVSKYQGRWIWCSHKARDTYEIPGGHRESGEDISYTARRELYEETGALEFDINPVCVYAVESGGTETFGMLFFADISVLEGELHSEIESIGLFDLIPERLTYPMIQPFLFERVSEWLKKRDGNL